VKETAGTAKEIIAAVGSEDREAIRIQKKQLLTKGMRSDYFDVYGVQARAELVLQPPTPNARLSC
jgi:hypothetical protein